MQSIFNKYVSKKTLNSIWSNSTKLLNPRVVKQMSTKSKRSMVAIGTLSIAGVTIGYDAYKNSGNRSTVKEIYRKDRNI